MDIDKEINNALSEIVDKFRSDFEDVANQVNDIAFKEVNKIYDEFIRQYYLYQTTSYIRHWEGRPGTRSGTNLYYGKDFKNHSGKDPYFEILISSDRMADDYQRDSAINVLSGVIEGYNSISVNGNEVWGREWSGHYHSKYFTYDGTLEGALSTFLENYEDIIYPIFMDLWGKKGW